MSEVPATMRAAVLHGRLDLTIEERERAEVGPRDVLLEVSHCGVCGTDLHYVLEGWGNRVETGRGPRVQRTRGCRRRCGRAMVSPATRWSAARRRGAGRASTACRCGRRCAPVEGRPATTTTASTTARSPNTCSCAEGSIVAIPPWVSLRAAALAEPLAVALHGLTQGGVRAGSALLITGAGPIGTLSIAAARAAA